MKKSIQILTFATVAAFSAAAFAGTTKSPGGNAKPTSGTSAGAAIRNAYQSVFTAGSGFSINVSDNGTVSITPPTLGSLAVNGGLNFDAVPNVSVDGDSYTIGASAGVVTIFAESP